MEVYVIRLLAIALVELLVNCLSVDAPMLQNILSKVRTEDVDYVSLVVDQHANILVILLLVLEDIIKLAESSEGFSLASIKVDTSVDSLLTLLLDVRRPVVEGLFDFLVRCFQ